MVPVAAGGRGACLCLSHDGCEPVRSDPPPVVGGAPTIHRFTASIHQACYEVGQHPTLGAGGDLVGGDELVFTRQYGASHVGGVALGSPHWNVDAVGTRCRRAPFDTRSAATDADPRRPGVGPTSWCTAITSPTGALLGLENWKRATGWRAATVR
jgi:hypothetical protein